MGCWEGAYENSSRLNGGGIRLARWAAWDHHPVKVTHGRVALVTGSSRGLGAVIARRLARDGFAVAVNGRPGDEQVAAVRPPARSPKPR
jgi:hypothetical protein